ncbi:NADH-quinone oxidoreductase subunit NuoE [Angustibacter sp. McL0619]|uniref:NADH-quinone oxidoreductase subunit NuoE n=1 Tax=Angustibacter sp. McL0619 TaxID=3415676 RepID=UPI003CF1CC72
MPAEYQATFVAQDGADTFADDVRARLEADAELIIARYPQKRSALLPLLHLMQSEEGFVSQRGVEFCASQLDLTTAEVAGVATFYTQYKRHPNGTYTVGVCTNTLCAIMGGDQIFDTLSDHLDVGHDETTEDGAITLERVECNAACDFAPVVMVNWEFFDNQTPSSARDLVDELRSGADVRPSRGASKVCTFKQVSRTLAGFSDGLADEGVGAAGPSLEGLKLAREKGWTAPESNGLPPSSPPVEQVAAEHVAQPDAPSANDAAVAQGDKGAAKTSTAKQASSKKAKED